MLHPAANSHPEATHQWLLMGTDLTHEWLLMGTARPHINGFLWPLWQPTGTPRPHINGFFMGRPSLPFASP